MPTKIGPILIGLAYLALVVFIIIFCAQQSETFEEYSQYWGLFATLIGVATGAIPSFFFKTQADRETERARKAEEQVQKEMAKAQLFAGAADPGAVERITADRSDLF